METNVKPIVVSNPHPLIGDGRLYYYEKFKTGETLGQYVERVGIEVPKGSIVVLINGALAMHDWRQYILQEGDDIVFRSSALGGGGGGKVLRLVATVALVVASAGFGGALGVAMGLTGNMAAAVGGALIMMGGTILLNALFPPPKPQMPAMKDKEQSPTYGINAGRNQANPYGPMLLVFGRHKVVPFLASKPYTSFSGDDQYLSQAFHFGLQTDLNLETIRIGDTDINNYQEVEINRSLHDGKLSLVSGNVDVLDGFELKHDMGWVERTTPRDTTFISADLAGNLYDINDKGDEVNMTLQVEAQYRKVGETNWRPLGGHNGVGAERYWSLGRYTTQERKDGRTTVPVWQQVRYGSTRPDEHKAGDKERICHKELSVTRYGYQEEVEVCEEYTWRYIPYSSNRRGGFKRGALLWQGSAPDPYGGYEGSGITAIQGKSSQKPTRHTIETAVERGQYEIRFRKLSKDIATTRKSNKANIAQIRCTQVDEADYTGQLRLAVRIKATSQLNGQIDVLNAIASAKCPVWNGSAWEEKETSNPAWWFLWWARGKRDINYRRLYGECLPDNRIDIEAIKAWAEFCERKNLTFNWVLDRKMNVEEVYYTIARAGRASTTWQTGKRGVIWDSDKLPVTTLLTPANIIAGSFSYKVINTDVADEIIVNFFDKEKNWEKSVVRQTVPGVQQTNNPITLDLEGCTDENQAGREANLLAASQHYHRKQYAFEMDIEGAVLTRGDVAQLTHDLTSYSAGGRLIAVDTTTGVITIDSEVAEKKGAWLSLRNPYNQIYTVKVNAKGNQLTVVGGWTFGEVGQAEDWLWQYDPVKTPGIKLQIKSVVPQSNGNVRFEAIEYIPDYFKAENNLYQAVPRKDAKDLPAIQVFDAYTTERVIDEKNGTTQVTLTWVMSEEANADVVIYNTETGAVLVNQRVHGYSTTVEAREGDVLGVEIRPFAHNRMSRTYTQEFVVVGTAVAIPNPTGLAIMGGFNQSTVRIKWERVVQATGYEVQVLSNGTIRRTVKIGDTLTYSYSNADMRQDGGLVRSLTFKVRALGKGQSKSEWVEVTGTNPQIGALQGIEITPNVKAITLTCHKPNEEDFAGFLYWISDKADFVPALDNVYLDTVSNMVFFQQINNKELEIKDYYIWCAGYDTFGKDSLNMSGSFITRPLQLKISGEMIEKATLDASAFKKDFTLPRANMDKTMLDDISTLSNRITQETKNRTQAIQAETHNRTKALQQEAQTRGNAITQLQNTDKQQAQQITTLTAKADKALSAIETEKVARVNETKAEAAKRDALVTRIGTVEGNIATMQRSITTQGQSLNEVSQNLNSKINNLNIGGRNFLRATHQLTNTDFWKFGKHGDQVQGEMERTDTVLTLKSITPDKWAFYYQRSTDNTLLEELLVEGQEITLSFEVKASSISGSFIRAFVRQFYTENGVNRSSNPIYRYFKHTKANKWEKLSLTGVVPALKAGHRLWNIIIEIRSNTPEQFEFKNIKLEKGNRATDWTPAPEDVDSNVTKVAADLTAYQKTQAGKDLAQAQQFNNLMTRVGVVEGNITVIQRTITTQGQSLNEVNQNLNARIDNLSVGGRNLIQNSEFTDYYRWGKSTITFSTEKERRAIKITSTQDTVHSGIASHAKFSKSHFEQGKQYTLSFYARGNITLLNYCYLMRLDGSNQLLTPITVSGDETNFRLYKLTFTAHFTTEQGYILFGFRNRAIGQWVEFHSLKLESGTIATDWTPAPEDVEGDIAKVLADLDNYRTTQANVTKAQATAIDKLTSRVGSTEANYSALSKTVSTTNKALGERIDTMQTTVGNNTAQVKQLSSTITTLDKALSERIDSLTSSVGNNSTQVRQVSNTVATLDGKVKATHSIQTQAIANGKTAIAGIKLGVESSGKAVESSVIVLADRFTIAKDVKDSSPKPVFIVANNKVGINGDLFVDGSIHGNKLAVNTVNGDRIVANTLHGNRIVANSLNGDRIITNTLHGNRVVANSITADKLAAKTITAQSGVLADAAITEAHIQNLSVDTIKIKDGAISRHLSYFGLSDSQTLNFHVPHQSKIIIFIEKGPISINSYAGNGYGSKLVVSVDGVNRITRQYGWQSSGGGRNEYGIPQLYINSRGQINACFTIDIPVGSHAIKIEIENRHGRTELKNMPISDLSIVIFGTMK
ncbi:host specificity factor TipJ family phage tail protein [Pelistega ratti]|uniref:host specificity factor TipJ family phage tail protein n=1 Tax=Pelistega ratti TaxID=2652177 RepID=UPI00135A178D|nr:host specificity factor TipJ family phage tail protein [Pelistega ratti]